MKIWFNKNFSSIAFMLEELQKNPAVTTTVFSHTNQVEHSKFADIFILEPECSEDYLAFCLGVCKQHNIDIFYPWRHFAKLYPQREQFAALGVKVIFPCSDSDFDSIDNKAAFYRRLLAKKLAIAIPSFETANTKTEFLEKYAQLRQHAERLCMKPSVSIYAAGFKVIHDEPEYDGWKALTHGKDKYAMAYTQLESLLPEHFFKEMMLLAYLSGDEYSHDILCNEGEVIAGTIRQKHQAHDKYQSLIHNAEIQRMSAILVAEFKLSGFINIQYRDDKHGAPFLLEINPRISGGFPKMTFAGIDYIDLFVKMLSNQAIPAHAVQQTFDIKVGSESRYVAL